MKPQRIRIAVNANPAVPLSRLSVPTLQTIARIIDETIARKSRAIIAADRQWRRRRHNGDREQTPRYREQQRNAALNRAAAVAADTRDAVTLRALGVK